MLSFLNALQLVLYIALLALVGQGVLYLIAGPRRDTNVFYRLLQVVAKPFTFVVRKLTPRQVDDRHVPLVTFFLLVIAYAVVTLERVQYCVSARMLGQAGCQ